jgi:hypothetical protein
MDRKHVLWKKNQQLGNLFNRPTKFADSFIYALITDPKNKIGELRFFFSLDRPKYFEAEFFVKRDIKK